MHSVVLAGLAATSLLFCACSHSGPPKSKEEALYRLEYQKDIGLLIKGRSYEEEVEKVKSLALPDKAARPFDRKAIRKHYNREAYQSPEMAYITLTNKAYNEGTISKETAAYMLVRMPKFKSTSPPKLAGVDSSKQPDFAVRGRTTNRIGNTYFHSDGTTTNRIGDTFFHSSGRTINRIGDTYFHSNGATTNRIGDTLFHSDGQTTNRIGDTFFHSDGSTTRRIGNTYFHSR